MICHPSQQLDNVEVVGPWLSSLGLQDVRRGQLNLISIAQSGVPLDLVQRLAEQLESELPRTSDPDMAVNNLERFFNAARSPLSLAALLARDPTALPILLCIFSNSQHLSDLLIQDTESYDALRLTEGQLITREALLDDLMGQIDQAADQRAAMIILRRFKRRETLRIGFADFIVGRRMDQITRQISFVADAICTAALYWAQGSLIKKWGQPMDEQGRGCQFVILAMGKLGGLELNYSSDIDLVMVYDSAGETQHAADDVLGPDQTSRRNTCSNQEFFDRLSRLTVKLMHETTALGAAYRVDLRLRPHGAQGRICNPLSTMEQYYDLHGRTWERQALIKARPVAGDLEMGHRLLDQLQPWIYRRHLNRFEIGGIASLKRQMERRATSEGEEYTNVKTGRGGIRDIEFAIQFLQLQHGGVLAKVRTTNTLDAIDRLAKEGCLSNQESTLLSHHYRWLRKLEHLLQIMFDLQTHALPTDGLELDKVALRMGYADSEDQTALEGFQIELKQTTEVNRKILNHLLHRAFEPSESTDGSGKLEVPIEVDLLLTYQADQNLIDQSLSPHGFKDIDQAYRNLFSMAREESVFMSTRRCRHFLAAIAPQFLREIAATPDPDSTLVSIASVSESIGGKGVLWELFNASPAAMRLFVRLCASSDYLASILRSNPGMIDELLDSLQLDALPTRERLENDWRELSFGATDIAPIIHSFKNVQHLRIGIRDILGRDEISRTHAALADIAELCLSEVAMREFQILLKKHGLKNATDDQAPTEFPMVILGLGKLGGREPNYHSDLDVMFLYQSDSDFESRLKPEITSQFFFSQLAAAISKFISSGRLGRLYEIDSRLRPTGKSGALAVSFDEFERYFVSGVGQLWEQQMLCKARAVFGPERLKQQATQLVRRMIRLRPWQETSVAKIALMRLSMEKGAGAENLKRGRGGTVDIEFMVQMLQLKQASQISDLETGTLAAIQQLKQLGAIGSELSEVLTKNYQFLRRVEAGLRLMNTTARHDLPTDSLALAKLDYLLRMDHSGGGLDERVAAVRAQTRVLFDRLFGNQA